jgi:hypothetical protein
MTLEELRARNDGLRTTLKGGRVLMSRAVRELDPQLRGRMLDRLTRYDRFDEDSDHSEGVFIFAGFGFYFRIEDNPRHGLILTVSLEADLLLPVRDTATAVSR